jgi:hypothetical protein
MHNREMWLKKIAVQLSSSTETISKSKKWSCLIIIKDPKTKGLAKKRIRLLMKVADVKGMYAWTVDSDKHYFDYIINGCHYCWHVSST